MSDKHSALVALRDRLAKATGPDRALDVGIADLVLGEIERWAKPMAPHGASRGVSYRKIPYTMTAPWWVPEAVHRDPDNAADVAKTLSDQRTGLPAYTASIDAAVTLVSRFTNITFAWAGFNEQHGHKLKAVACIELEDGTIQRSEITEAHEPTCAMALALCLARVEYEIAKAKGDTGETNTVVE